MLFRSLATGSRVSPSPLPQLDEVGYITSDDAVALKQLPKSLIILGGGAIACEFAQFFARFGVKTTLIQRSKNVLKEFDADVGTEIKKVFQREGIQVFTDTKLVDAGRKGKLKSITFEQDGRRVTVFAEEILFALGRVPNTTSLDLAKAGVKTDAAGRVSTNAKMQTSVPHIFAAGDVCGPHEIVHIAIQQGETAVHNMVKPRAPRRMDYRLLISVVFTEPQVATVGLTEKAARENKIPFITASSRTVMRFAIAVTISWMSSPPLGPTQLPPIISPVLGFDSSFTKPSFASMMSDLPWSLNG